MTQKQKHILQMVERMRALGVRAFKCEGIEVDFGAFVPPETPHPHIIDELSVEQTEEQQREQLRREYEQVAFYSS